MLFNLIPKLFKSSLSVPLLNADECIFPNRAESWCNAVHRMLSPSFVTCVSSPPPIKLMIVECNKIVQLRWTPWFRFSQLFVSFFSLLRISLNYLCKISSWAAKILVINDNNHAHDPIPVITLYVTCDICNVRAPGSRPTKFDERGRDVWQAVLAYYFPNIFGVCSKHCTLITQSQVVGEL